MRMNRPICILIAILSCSVLLTACEKRKEKPKLSPSVASAQAFDSVMAHVRRGEITSEAEFEAARNRYCARIIGNVRSDSLQGEELFTYGQLLAWSGNERKAREVFESMRKGAGRPASAAWKELITLDIEARRYAEAEAMMKEYRSAFPPDTSDLEYLSSQCSSLAGRYGEGDEPEAALRVCEDELNALPLDAPYASFHLVEGIASDMMQMGRLDESRAILDKYRTGLQASLALYERRAPADSAAKKNDAVAEGFRRLVESLSSLSAQYDLIGKKAPGFKFLHVYNADSTLTLDKLKGKVVMLDFWATWCMPCVIGFTQARRVYDDYKGKGFEILGITSLQGTYHDKDSGIAEGTEDKPLDKTREIELTGSYVKKRQIVWPCAISDRSVFDPAYKIGAIPTFVLIDREGIVRFIQSGIGGEKQQRRLINKLIMTS